MQNYLDLKNKAALIREWCLVSTSIPFSGHPTSCLSAVDLGVVLFNNFFSYDLNNPNNPNNDRLVFSKGHSAPLLYALFAVAGALPFSELKTLRKFGSRLEGHPTPYFPYAEAATGSLGQGLSIGAGEALAIRSQIRNSKFEIRNFPKVYVLLGDGEVEEGNVWEAANFASYNRLDNLIAIVDVNGLELSGKTIYGHDVKRYSQIFSSFGFETITINGHDFFQINEAFKKAQKNKTGKPIAIIADTIKGKGVSFLEDKDGWHGKPLKKDDLEKALKELGEVDEGLRFKLKKPSNILGNARVQLEGLTPEYKLGQEVATREAFGDVLLAFGKEDSNVYAVDADVSNSTYTDKFKKEIPGRFVQSFIAEQNMVGIAAGLSKMGKIPFVSTFASFLTRAFDQIRMAAISRSNIKFNGSHAGVSIGEDGPSQMGLEDFAMFGAIPDSIIFHPCDAVSTAKIMPLIRDHCGISYLRTLRPKTPVIYKDSEKFKLGGSKILRSAQNDILTIAACGITVFEALKAHEHLKKEGINIRVVDCYCLKPLDSKTMKQCVNETINPIVITVEDHYEHGGLGDFVLSALAETGAKVVKMAVNKIPRSGTKEDLLEYEEINAKAIVKKVKSFC